MPRVLVVCTANQARSPLAAALLQREVDRRAPDQQVHVDSAGLQARPGAPVLAEVLEAARSLGLRLDEHRARPLEAGDIEGSDLVVTLGEDHRREINRRCRAAVHRTFTLRELDRLLGAEGGDGAPAAATDSPGSLADQSLRERVQRLSGLRPWVTPPAEAEDVPDPARDPRKLVPPIARQLSALTPRVARGLFPD